MKDEIIFTKEDYSWHFEEPCDFDSIGAAHVLLGPCPICATPSFNYGGGWRCRDYSCNYSPNNPTPSLGNRPAWWDRGVILKKDGNMWCAHRHEFINLQESNAGFGLTAEEAVKELLVAEAQP